MISAVFYLYQIISASKSSLFEKINVLNLSIIIYFLIQVTLYLLFGLPVDEGSLHRSICHSNAVTAVPEHSGQLR